jgi:hypothetical protein
MNIICHDNSIDIKYRDKRMGFSYCLNMTTLEIDNKYSMTLKDFSELMENVIKSHKWDKETIQYDCTYKFASADIFYEGPSRDIQFKLLLPRDNSAKSIINENVALKDQIMKLEERILVLEAK